MSDSSGLTSNNSNPSPNNYHNSQHWGLWGTLGFGFLIFIVFGILQSVILFAFAFSKGLLNLEMLKDKANSEKIIEQIAYNGDLIAFSEIPSAIIGVSLIIFFASLKKPFPINDYLQLRIPASPIKTLFKWIAIMVLVFVAMESVNILLERETPEFMSKVYGSSSNKFLLWIAVAVAAPFFEEFLFRGFLLEGLRHTRMGVVGAILLTSAGWAIIHMQYGWFEIITIFLIGIIFAIAQLKTKSLYVPIAMHMFMNLTASIMMEVTN